MSYTLADFDYKLPTSLIAQTPVEPRDHSRLLVYDRASASITDDYFYNLPSHVRRNTAFIANNSKVEKCRIVIDSIELFILETINPSTVKALVFPGRKFREGKEITLGDIKITTIAVDDESGVRTLQLSPDMNDQVWDTYKQTPFPPYIAHNEAYAKRYQTTYADPLGSKAAPTAGLHFTPELIKTITKDHVWAELTLHVGLGTFAPVKTDDLSAHKMHSEYYEIPKRVADIINRADHITAIGTTSARTLESYAATKHLVDSTDIFITPGYKFKNVGSLVTNFHLPKSTLLMMIAAFMGFDEMKRVYGHAIAEKYRFYSFGDAMLIL
jgi:S-adenosylmethionine:tRNA ribosyltransferase-isomerase